MAQGHRTPCTGARLSDLGPPGGWHLKWQGQGAEKAPSTNPSLCPRPALPAAACRRTARAVPVTSSSSSRLCMYSGHCCWVKYSSSMALDIQKRRCCRSGARPARDALAAEAGSGLPDRKTASHTGASHTGPALGARTFVSTRRQQTRQRAGRRGEAGNPEVGAQPDSQRLVCEPRQDHRGPPAPRGSGGHAISYPLFWN